MRHVVIEKGSNKIVSSGLDCDSLRSATGEPHIEVPVSGTFSTEGKDTTRLVQSKRFACGRISRREQTAGKSGNA